MLIRGNQLKPATQREVLSAYIYRWTSDNPRRTEAYRNLSTPTIPLTTDVEWLADHAFHVRKDGGLMRNRTHAEPAWMAA